MKETEILKKIQIAASSTGIRLLRNNCGSFKDSKGRWIKFGVGNPGGADLLGWKTVEITQDMVGQEMAQFVALEIKRPGGKVTAEQLNFLHAVHQAGGIATVCHSTEEALDAIS